jgi:cystathionine beta-synthase
LFNHATQPSAAVDSVLESALPMLGASEPVSEAVAALTDNDALLVLEGGKPSGIVTRQDLLTDIN